MEFLLYSAMYALPKLLIRFRRQKGALDGGACSTAARLQGLAP